MVTIAILVGLGRQATDRHSICVMCLSPRPFIRVDDLKFW